MKQILSAAIWSAFSCFLHFNCIRKHSQLQNIIVLIFHQLPFWAYHHPLIKSLIIHKLFSVLLFSVVFPCTLKFCLSLSLGKYSLQKWKQSTWSYVTREGWRQWLCEKMSDENNNVCVTRHIGTDFFCHERSAGKVN